MFLRFILQTDKWPYTSRMISGRVPSFSAEAEGVRGSHCGRWSFHPCALGPSITKRIWTQVTDGGHVTSSEMLFALVLDLIIFHIIIYTIYICICCRYQAVAREDNDSDTNKIRTTTACDVQASSSVLTGGFVQLCV